MTENDNFENVKLFCKKNKKNNEKVEKKIITLPKCKTKYLTVVDDDSGEIEAYVKLPVKTLGKDWVAVYQSAMSMIADWNLPNEQYRVFLKLLSKLDFDNYLRISQAQFSKELGIKQPNIARAIKALENKGVIVEGPRAGLNKTYRLNPYIAHKGKNRTQTIADFLNK